MFPQNFTLKKLNSITKYPSIPTYHAIQKNNTLIDQLTKSFAFPGNLLEFYEKVDGENARFVFVVQGSKVDFYIGSREELLIENGKQIFNGNDLVSRFVFLTPLAEKIATKLSAGNYILVIFQEAYGGNTPMAFEYTSGKTQDYRVFDAFRLDEDEVNRLFSLKPEQIAGWRQRNGQPYMTTLDRNTLAEELEMKTVPLLFTMKGDEFPTSLDEVYAVLKEFQQTKVGIDANGKPEGLMVRTTDRKEIAKIRHEDYEKTYRLMTL